MAPVAVYPEPAANGQATPVATKMSAVPHASGVPVTGAVKPQATIEEMAGKWRDFSFRPIRESQVSREMTRRYFNDLDKLPGTLCTGCPIAQVTDYPSDRRWRKIDRCLSRRVLLYVLEVGRHDRLRRIEIALGEEDGYAGCSEDPFAPERVWDDSWPPQVFLTTDRPNR